MFVFCPTIGRKWWGFPGNFVKDGRDPDRWVGDVVSFCVGRLISIYLSIDRGKCTFVLVHIRNKDFLDNCNLRRPSLDIA